MRMWMPHTATHAEVGCSRTNGLLDWGDGMHVQHHTKSAVRACKRCNATYCYHSHACFWRCYPLQRSLITLLVQIEVVSTSLLNNADVCSLWTPQNMVCMAWQHCSCIHTIAPCMYLDARIEPT